MTLYYCCKRDGSLICSLNCQTLRDRIGEYKFPQNIEDLEECLEECDGYNIYSIEITENDTSMLTEGGSLYDGYELSWINLDDGKSELTISTYHKGVVFGISFLEI
jgi:hypothetical protein